MYIENTAKIRSTPKWQEAMDQSLFVSGGGGGGGFWERSHGFQGGLRGGGNQSSLTESLGGDYGKLTVNEGRGVIRILKN